MVIECPSLYSSHSTVYFVLVNCSIYAVRTSLIAATGALVRNIEDSFCDFGKPRQDQTRIVPLNIQSSSPY